MLLAVRPGIRRVLGCAMAAVVATATMAGAAGAQMMLPGAVTAPPAGAPVAKAPKIARPHAASSKPRAASASASASAKTFVPATPVVPSPRALAGKTLVLDGNRSQVAFVAADKQVAVGRLNLLGTMISNSRAECRVQADATPIATTSLGRPAGVERLQVGFPACPILFDVLDGAVLGVAGQPACNFKEADCHVDPAGLWGPATADFTPAGDKAIERARGRAEAQVRANYKALVGATKDRPTIMGFAREQAQFSSTREETCRDYAGEGQHGYCAMKLTEARVADLAAKVGPALAAKAARLAKKRAHAAR